jgi:hypothetical protein
MSFQIACASRTWRSEQRLVEQLVTQSCVEALDEGILLWLTGRDGAMECYSIRISCDQRRIAIPVSSLPLSETRIARDGRELR